MSGKRNLILGLWSRHAFPPLEPFVASLRNTAFDGDVCIFVDDTPTETVTLLQSHGFIVERAAPTSPAWMTPLSGRFFSYLEFLAAHGAQYDTVMLTDLRDVVFQSDPFEQPLPAEIVFAQERTRLGDSALNRAWVVQAYGEAVAENMRDCLVSCAGTTFGTTRGILQYLVAMTRELASRTTPIVGGIDQGIHNYVVHMHPLPNAWLDTTDSLVATMHFVPEASVRCDEQGIRIDGRLVPVLHQWDRNPTTGAYVKSASRFRLAGLPAARMPTVRCNDAVVAFYLRERDAEWLPLFLSSLRCIGFTGDVHCIGQFNADELRLLSQHGAVAYAVAATAPMHAENIAHFYLGQMLDRLAQGTAQPDQVLLLDSMRAVFLRDPFHARSMGLSVFAEGPTWLGDSEYNLQRLQFFVTPDQARRQQPIISSALLRGPLHALRPFYHKLLAEFVGRSELLGIHKSIQGAVNKLCHDGGFEFPIFVHPNGAEAYFDIWPSDLAVNRQQGVRIGGTVPGVVLGESIETKLLLAIRTNLGLPAS